jgi:hypothetical protein
MARANPEFRPLIVSELSMLAEGYTAEIKAMAEREPPEGHEAVRRLALTMTAIDLKVPDIPTLATPPLRRDRVSFRIAEVNKDDIRGRARQSTSNDCREGARSPTKEVPMNAFTTASLVEQRGLAILLPYLEERAFKGRIVSTARGTLARTLQQDFGGYLLNTDDRTVWAVEIKIEQVWTGDLFLETWSNRNLESKVTHAKLGSTPGWLIKTRADMLLCYFLDTVDLVTVPVFRLKQWAFGSGEEGGIYRFLEKRQGRYAQANDSWGRCVPVDVLGAGDRGQAGEGAADVALWMTPSRLAAPV